MSDRASARSVLLLAKAEPTGGDSNGSSESVSSLEAVRYRWLINPTGWAPCIGSLAHPQIHLASVECGAIALSDSRGDVCWGIGMANSIPEAWEVVWRDAALLPAPVLPEGAVRAGPHVSCG